MITFSLFATKGQSCTSILILSLFAEIFCFVFVNEIQGRVTFPYPHRVMMFVLKHSITASVLWMFVSKLIKRKNSRFVWLTSIGLASMAWVFTNSFDFPKPDGLWFYRFRFYSLQDGFEQLVVLFLSLEHHRRRFARQLGKPHVAKLPKSFEVKFYKQPIARVSDFDNKLNFCSWYKP